MKKKLMLKKETVALLDSGMGAVRGGAGTSDKCDSYLHDDHGVCLVTYSCPDTYICPLPAVTTECSVVECAVDTTDCIAPVSYGACNATVAR